MSASLVTLPGVYAPQHDTRLLAEVLRHEPLPPGTEVLDVGTGTGALALTAAARGARVTAVDISRLAVFVARLNAWRRRAPLRVLHGDLFAPVARHSFDLILANPPYVPALAPHPPRRGAARAWDAGYDGRCVLDRICRTAPALLRPGGRLLLVHSVLSSPSRTLGLLRQHGLHAEVVRRSSVPFGPVLTARQQWLRDRKLLSDSATCEGLVVVRAVRSD
ncbi:HemK2/MTQ2 family protein methyltransferase [Streptomyces sp. G45]|uniref:HemK2/MTQ2 family protein methyltransferase n=1 Tax=Streptomyces sp. G45 TaxID=3406627 RepID=UPI003C2423AF